jgi:hypothetical protein
MGKQHKGIIAFPNILARCSWKIEWAHDFWELKNPIFPKVGCTKVKNIGRYVGR